MSGIAVTQGPVSGTIPKFPSPSGVNIVGNRFTMVTSYYFKFVSVPLRGKYCRECSLDSLSAHYFSIQFPSPCGVNIVGNAKTNFEGFGCDLVSVPLRGKYCRECLSKLFEAQLDGKLFPSPCGVNIVGNYLLWFLTLITFFLVSVPLRGKYCRESL